MREERPTTSTILRCAILAIAMLCTWLNADEPAAPPQDDATRKLAREVADKGWIVFSARARAGDFDLFVSRPDGSNLRHLTDTRAFDELGARLSPDGKKLLYRRLTMPTPRVDHVGWGAFGTLVMADADGSNPVVQGRSGEYPFAIWSQDGRKIACLYRRQGQILVYDMESKKLQMDRPSQGIFRQLGWSPDGKLFLGSANVDGMDWNIVTIDINSGQRTLLSRGSCCTPDWIQPAGTSVVYSCGEGEEREGGWVVEMQATVDGKSRSLVYAERGQHIYFGCTSPDGKYVIFSRRPRNMGPIEGEMAIVRMADAPIVAPGGEAYDQAMRMQYGQVHTGPVLHLTNLPAGFEPHWTDADLGEKR